MEKSIVDSGIVLLKYWLEVSQDEQTRRLASRINDGRKILEAVTDGPKVLQSLVRLFAPATRCSRQPTLRGRRGTSFVQRSARLNTITQYLLRQIEYEEAPREKVRLPDRQKPHGYKEPNYPCKLVPELNWPVG